MLGGKDAVITAEKGAGTPLFWAARAVCDGGNGAAPGLELAKLLLEEGVEDVNAVGKDEEVDECTPLFWAALAVINGMEGGLELAKLLLEEGADVNAVSMCYGNKVPLVYWAATAACRGEEVGLGLMKLLLEEGAEVNAVKEEENGNTCTSLCLAAKAVRRFIDNEDNDDDEVNEEYVDAAMEAVRLLLSAGAELADGESDCQKDVDEILGAWVAHPHARNEHFELTQRGGVCIECSVCLEEVAARGVGPGRLWAQDVRQVLRAHGGGPEQGQVPGVSPRRHPGGKRTKASSGRLTRSWRLFHQGF
mmetsp:Transcript_4593/g.11609  ORF Transcript_4593/g.11609 Transcript_4593/m.11609 type:complete len:306 (+) Transcript_4593:165-1082(+)